MRLCNRKGTNDLDAAVLLMPMMRFISPVDPMWLSTMKAIEEQLVEDTLVRRYQVERSGGRPPRKRGQLHTLFVLVRRMSGAERAGWKRHNCCLRSAVGLRRTTSVSVQKSWVRTGSILGTSRRRSHISALISAAEIILDRALYRAQAAKRGGRCNGEQKPFSAHCRSFAATPACGPSKRKVGNP